MILHGNQSLVMLYHLLLAAQNEPRDYDWAVFHDGKRYGPYGSADHAAHVIEVRRWVGASIAKIKRQV